MLFSSKCFLRSLAFSRGFRYYEVFSSVFGLCCRKRFHELFVLLLLFSWAKSLCRRIGEKKVCAGALLFSGADFFLVPKNLFLSYIYKVPKTFFSYIYKKNLVYICMYKTGAPQSSSFHRTSSLSPHTRVA